MENLGPSMQTYVQSWWIGKFFSFITLRIDDCNSGQNGSATEMWITLPSSENDPFLDFVKSKNCVGNAKWPGSISSFKLPTAEGAIILVIPNSLNAQIFAL